MGGSLPVLGDLVLNRTPGFVKLCAGFFQLCPGRIQIFTGPLQFDAQGFKFFPRLPQLCLSTFQISTGLLQLSLSRFHISTDLLQFRVQGFEFLSRLLQLRKSCFKVLSGSLRLFAGRLSFLARFLQLCRRHLQIGSQGFHFASSFVEFRLDRFQLANAGAHFNPVILLEFDDFLPKDNQLFFTGSKVLLGIQSAGFQ